MSKHIYQRRPVEQSALPNVIFALLVANGLVFAAQQLMRTTRFVEAHFALWPLDSVGYEFQFWQLVTYGFLHSPDNLTHILFNMFGLWMFGRDIEWVLGSKRFLIYYLTCVVGAGIVQLTVAAVQGHAYPTLGASGGVFGLLLAYAMFFPNRTVMLLFPPIPMKAKYFVLAYGLLELYLGVSGRAPGIANFAHLGGMFFGYVLLKRWQHARRP